MHYLIGSSSQRSYRAVKAAIPNVGMLFQPSTWRPPCCLYALDNDVFNHFQKGRVWEEGMHLAYTAALNKLPIDFPPEWVLLPDAIADWPRTVELAALYLPLLRQRGLSVALALQDGCNFEQALAFAPDWVFVGGSTEWKEAILPTVCQFFRPRRIRVHVGRVNTKRRLLLCRSVGDIENGVNSCDGTVLNKFRDAHLDLIAVAIKQPCPVREFGGQKQHMLPVTKRCPFCSSARVARNGRQKATKRQKLRCLECGKHYQLAYTHAAYQPGIDQRIHALTDRGQSGGR